MSLMNDALRKKKRERKPPPGTEMVEDHARQRAKSSVKIYGLAAAGALACVLAGFYLYELTSISQPMAPVRPSVAMVEEQASRVPTSPEAEAPDRGVPAEATPSTEMPPPDNAMPGPETDLRPRTPSASPMQATAEPPPPKMPPPADDAGDTPSLPVVETREIRPQPATAPGTAPAPPGEPEAPPAAAADSPEAPFYRKGLSYHRQNQIDKAIQMYRAVLTHNPDHRAARFNLASAYIQVAAFGEARTILESLDRDDPGNPDILLNLAVVEIGLDRPEEALVFLDQAGRGRAAPAFEILFHRGLAHSRMGNFEEALTVYQQAERLAPGHTRLFLNKAVVLDSLARYGQAVDAYQMYLDTSDTMTGPERGKIEMRIRELKTYLATVAARSADNPPSKTEP